MTKARKNIGTAALSAKEIEILRWVQEGKTNREIGIILKKTQWAVKHHLKNIFLKLDVVSRAQALSQAIGMGLIAASSIHEAPMQRLKIGVVGLGRGGAAILNLFKDNPAAKVLWAADMNPHAPGLKTAKELRIPASSDFREFIDEKVDVIINLTGSASVAEELRRFVPATTELMGGLSAKIMWQLFEERRKRADDRERVLKGHDALYHLGLVVENIHSLRDVGYAIIDYATKLMNTPAGSLALFDEKREDMFLVAAKGFSPAFKKTERWDIRKGGLTSLILNQSSPLFYGDIREMPDPSPLLLKEGVRTLLAAPLTVEGRIVGILYVNDFKRRTFRAEDVSLFSLLSIYAGLTVERVKTIEQTRLLSITDGLTGLHNQRYLMEQIQKELIRAERHKHSLSVLMLDVDRFKDYNDAYGHLDGNRVLKALSMMLKKNSRVTDVVGRFGGEEFCIVMPQITKEGAVAFSKRILSEIEKYPMPNRKITVSGGLAFYPGDGKTHLALLKKADARLYRSKNEGRNKLYWQDRGRG